MKTQLAFIVLAGYLILAEAVLELKNIDLADFASEDQGFSLLVDAVDNIAFAGDVNDDGLSDLIIGHPISTLPFPPPGTGIGRAYLIFGIPGGIPSGVNSNNWSNTYGITIEGVPEAQGNRLGYNVGYAGDLNNDGIDDIYIGTYDFYQNGVVYIIFGGDWIGTSGDIDVSTLTYPRGIRIIHTGSQIGFYCNRLGDVNGDTIDDFGITSTSEDSAKGAVYIIFGGAGVHDHIDLSSSLASSGLGIQLFGEIAGDNFGYSLSSGDINGDNINDIIVGAPYFDPDTERADAGAVYVIFGRVGLGNSGDIYASSLGSNGFKIKGEKSGDWLGSTEGKCGDFNGDDKSDIALVRSDPNSHTGTAYVIFNKVSWPSEVDLVGLTNATGIKISGIEPSGITGRAAIEFLDLNRDGIADLFVSSPYATPTVTTSRILQANPRNQAGIVYVMLGKTNGLDHLNLADFDNTQGITILGYEEGRNLGSNLIKTRDFNGDGQDDMIMLSFGNQGTFVFYSSSAQIIPLDNGNNRDDKIIQRIVDFEVTAGTIIATAASALQMSQSGAMAVITGVLLAKQLQFVRYIDVGYSPRLMLTFQKQPYNLVTVNFGPLFPESLEDDAFKFPASPRFARYINRLLVVNFWRGLTTFGILLVVLCIAFVLRRIPIKNPTLKLVRDKLQSFILLNYMFSFILSNTDNIILFSIVDYKSFNLDDGLATASFVISILCLLLLLGILSFIPWHLYRLRKHKKYQNKEDKLKAYDSSKVLFEEVKDKYFVQELYLFIICFRVVLHNIIIGALETPILQASLLIVLNILMVTYIVTLLPHQKMITNIEVVGYEIMIFIANVTCLCIATLDPADQPNAQISGDVILVSNVIVIAFSMLITGLKVLLKILPIIKEKLAARKKKLIPIQTEQTPLALQTPTEECSPSAAKSPKCEEVEMEGESLLVVPEEDTESNKIERKITSAIRPLETLGKIEMESNRELLSLESGVSAMQRSNRQSSLLNNKHMPE